MSDCAISVSKMVLSRPSRKSFNEVAFSPSEPVLAIATSQRKVALWNFQTATVERVLQDFIHSVGKVAYTPKGVLTVAEKTSQQSICAFI